MKKSPIFLVLAGALFSSNSNAACNPVDFQVRDSEHVIADEYFAASLFSHLSKEQFETLKKDFATSGKYAKIFEGNVDYDEYKRRVETFKSTLDLRMVSRNSLEYVAQKLSPAALANYSKCVEHDSSILGLNVWLHERTAEYYTLKARWIGGETESGVLANVVQDKVVVVSQLPKNWSRAFTYEISLRKDNCADSALLILQVNNNSKNFIVWGDPPQPQYSRETVQSVRPAHTGSGGNNAAVPATDTQCISPTKPGARLDPTTAVFTNVQRSDASRTHLKWTTKTPTSVCWEVGASTTAKEKAVTIYAGAAVEQIVPQGSKTCDGKITP